MLLLFLQPLWAQNDFIKIRNGQFQKNDRPFYFIGANYWYGGILGLTEAGKHRIRQELDFLKLQGVNNLRVMAAIEGSGLINGNPRIEPAYQPVAGQFREDVLNGLDFLLAELQQRGMTAVLMLSNNWEWSGGFLQYLNWNGQLADSVLSRKMEWEDMRDHISRFYSSSSCISQYQEQVKRIITRVNSITGKKYTADPAILSWEIANEPRPMRHAAIEAYRQFIHSSAMLIRSLDSNHLITTGSEGDIGSETMAVYKTVHQDKYIDYLTIHIWPKNWGWFSDKKMADQFSQVIRKTRAYVRKHRAVATALKKPLVIEEFGLPRDGQSFSLTSATTYRDRYYSFLFSKLSKDAKKGGPVAGAVFWAFGGIGRPAGQRIMWQSGDDWLGDPPMEEQGLNTVFDQDKNTWLLIRRVTTSLAVSMK